MEAIRNYLETMFANLPNTPEVYKAKNELWQMMEDKYTELKEEGRSDNEAVGTVISEFGNLDELAKDLGIKQFIQPDSQMQEQITLPLEQVKKYLSDYAGFAYRIALGILLCIVALAMPVIFSDSSQYMAPWLVNLGGVLFLIFTAIGVGIFVYSGIQIGRWNYLKRNRFLTDFATTDYIQHELQHYKSTHTLLLTIGIVTCILSMIPVILLDTIPYIQRFNEDLPTALTLLIASIGVFLIVMTSIKNNSYHHLLHLNRQDTVSGNYVPEQKNENQYINPGVQTVLSIFWPTVTCLYLIWSFITFDWWISWVIWPIAGIIHSVIKNTLKK